MTCPACLDTGTIVPLIHDPDLIDLVWDALARRCRCARGRRPHRPHPRPNLAR